MKKNAKKSKISPVYASTTNFDTCVFQFPSWLPTDYSVEMAQFQWFSTFFQSRNP